MKKVLSGVLVILVLVSLVACGSSDPIVGDWKLTKVSAYGQEFSAEEFAEMSGMDLSTIGLTIKSNGTFTMEIPGETGRGRWKQDGDNYELTDDTDDVIVLTYDASADEVALEVAGAKLIFDRK